MAWTTRVIAAMAWTTPVIPAMAWTTAVILANAGIHFIGARWVQIEVKMAPRFRGGDGFYPGDDQ